MRRKILASSLVIVVGLGIAVAAVLFAPGDAPGAPAAWAQASRWAPTDVVLSFSVGGVLTGDGTLWIYRPDLEKWFTVDEAFKEEGRDTHVLPLPVPVTEIRDMSTYGFIVTTSGQIWLYEHAANQWRRLPAPAR